MSSRPRAFMSTSESMSVSTGSEGKRQVCYNTCINFVSEEYALWLTQARGIKKHVAEATPVFSESSH